MRAAPSLTVLPSAGDRPTTQVRTEAARSRLVGGALLTLAGAGILMGSITAEALYPRLYTTHDDTLSHLGATEPPNSIVLQPSASIFDLTMLVTGVMILGAAWFVWRGTRSRIVAIPIGALGAGVLGVGLFPLTSPTQHTLVALVAFYAAGVAAICSARLTRTPLRQLSLGLGAVSLVAITAGLFLSHWGPVAALGEGGIERWNAYPALLWMVAFGGWLMASPDDRAGA